MARATKVLLVDDDSNVRQALHQALVLEDFAVMPAQDGAEALQVFSENAIDVVLLDLDLGPEDGWRTYERLKRLRPHLPVVLMTASPERHAAQAESAFAKVLEKPLDVPLLVRTLNTLAAQDGHNHAERPLTQPQTTGQLTRFGPVLGEL